MRHAVRGPSPEPVYPRESSCAETRQVRPEAPHRHRAVGPRGRARKAVRSTASCSPPSPSPSTGVRRLRRRAERRLGPSPAASADPPGADATVAGGVRPADGRPARRAQRRRRLPLRRPRAAPRPGQEAALPCATTTAPRSPAPSAVTPADPRDIARALLPRVRLLRRPVRLPRLALDRRERLARQRRQPDLARRTASRRRCPARRWPPPAPTGRPTRPPRSVGPGLHPRPLRHPVRRLGLQARPRLVLTGSRRIRRSRPASRVSAVTRVHSEAQCASSSGIASRVGHRLHVERLVELLLGDLAAPRSPARGRSRGSSRRRPAPAWRSWRRSRSRGTCSAG